MFTINYSVISVADGPAPGPARPARAVRSAVDKESHFRNTFFYYFDFHYYFRTLYMYTQLLAVYSTLSANIDPP